MGMGKGRAVPTQHSTGTAQTVKLYTHTKYINAYTTRHPEPYDRYRIITEWLEDTSADDEEPNGSPSYVVGLDDYQGERRYLRRLTWERWVSYLYLDGDAEQAMYDLRSHASTGYQLYHRKSGVNVLVFKSSDEAVKVAQLFCQSLGTDSLR